MRSALVRRAFVYNFDWTARRPEVFLYLVMTRIGSMVWLQAGADSGNIRESVSQSDFGVLSVINNRRRVCRLPAADNAMS
jgi:hypothetical protein